MAVLRKAALTVLGGLLILVGCLALVLPGPGLLLLLSGFAVLAREYAWAKRHIAAVRRKAVRAAIAGVASYSRIVLSALSAGLVVAAGVVWCLDPTVPVIGPIGPALPFGGWETGSVIVLSGCVALGLLIYSVVAFRQEPAVRPGPPPDSSVDTTAGDRPVDLG